MKRGFSLIALAVIVIITLILATSVTIAANNTINNSKKIAFGTEIKLVEDSVASYRARSNDEFPVKSSLIFDFEALTLDSSKRQFIENGETVKDGKITFYTIDYEACNLSNLKYGNGEQGANDFYVVSKETGKVYLPSGIKIGNVTYFTLTKEIENILNMGWTSSEVSGIVFEPSTTEWTSKPVNMNVKVPKSYVVISIRASDGTTLFKNDNLSAMDDNYDIYQLTMTEAKNYYVEATYKMTENSRQKTTSYNVLNVDKSNPVISSINMTNTSSSITLEVMAEDLGSGISKYYFSKDGITYYESESNKFTFENLEENKTYTSLCVRVEDKVENKSVRTGINGSTSSIGSISISGSFDTTNTPALIDIIFNPLVSNTARYYKINNDNWQKVEGLSEKFYIEEDSVIYAKLVDSSGQKMEVSKIINKSE